MKYEWSKNIFLLWELFVWTYNLLNLCNNISFNYIYLIVNISIMSVVENLILNNNNQTHHKRSILTQEFTNTKHKPHSKYLTQESKLKKNKTTPNISGAYIHWKQKQQVSLYWEWNNTRTDDDLQRTRSINPFLFLSSLYSQCFPIMEMILEPAPFNLCFLGLLS